jgi:hypothetical protein
MGAFLGIPQFGPAMATALTFARTLGQTDSPQAEGASQAAQVGAERWSQAGGNREAIHSALDELMLTFDGQAVA